MPGKRIFWFFFLPGVLGLMALAMALYLWEITPTYAFAIGLGICFVSAALVSAVIGKTLDQMRRSVERFGAGFLEHRVAIPPTSEFIRLAAAMNDMARSLHQRVSLLSEERKEQEAVLAAMIEGILAVDNEEKVIRANRAAGEILGFDHTRATNRSIQEVVRLPDCHKFVHRALGSDDPLRAEIDIPGSGRPRILDLNALPLRDLTGRDIGILLVINDVTQLRRLEQVRSDFVANVSHELMTPVTSIKGFVETMLSAEEADREEQQHFLEIVLRQANRMHAIIEDLLALSRLEETTGEENQARWEKVSLASIVDNTIRLASHQAIERNIELLTKCDEQMHVRGNPALLEQAVSNLIENAIKYSDEGTHVEIRAEAGPAGKVQISVRDEGCGIAKEHLPRIFERFYRVDKARSRKVGGTGLGLSIVKHIAQIHGGSVAVESRPGAGSTFTIQLPGRQDAVQEN